jgi:hypothetical protein
MVSAVSIKLLSYRSNYFLNSNILKQSDVMVRVPKKEGFLVNSSLYAVQLSGLGTEFTTKKKIKLSQYC